MTLTVEAITIDCDDVTTVRRFWAAALGWREVAGGADWSFVEHADGRRPRICVQRVPEGKLVKNRVHLDVRVGAAMTFDRERVRLEELGATAIRLHGTGPGDRHWQMTDPEGNEFCLIDAP